MLFLSINFYQTIQYEKKIRDFAWPSISYIELVLTFRYQINNHEDDWKHVKIPKTFIFMHKMVYVIFRVK